MTDKEIIRTEIEKLKSDANSKRFGNQFQSGIESACNHMLLFIDSMQEESISEDLESEIQHYYIDWDEHPEYVQTARHFAKWQRQQDEHLIWQLSSSNYEKGKQEAREEMMKGAIGAQVFGATDVKQLYEGKIYLISNLFQDVDYGLRVNDRVKLIIIK